MKDVVGLVSKANVRVCTAVKYVTDLKNDEGKIDDECTHGHSFRSTLSKASTQRSLKGLGKASQNHGVMKGYSRRQRMGSDNGSEHSGEKDTNMQSASSSGKAV